MPRGRKKNREEIMKIIKTFILIIISSLSSDYQKQYTTSMANSCLQNIVQNVSVITSTTDVVSKGNNSTFVMPPVLNLSNKK